MNSFKEAAKMAIERDELYELFYGKNEYKIDTRYMPVDVPTDINSMMESGIYALCNADNTSNIEQQLIDLLDRLFAGSDEDVWIAFNICWAEAYFSKTGTSPFSFLTEEYVNKHKENFNERKESLMRNHIWTGKNLESGLWGDIESANTTLVRKYGVSLL